MKVREWIVWLMALLLSPILIVGGAQAATLTVSPATLTLKIGGAAGTASISNVSGTLQTPSISNSNIASVTRAASVPSPNACPDQADSAGQTRCSP